MYVYIFIYICYLIKHGFLTNHSAHRVLYLYNFTGVQASGVVIVYCDSAVSYDPKLYDTTLIWQLQRVTVKIEVQTCFESSASLLLFVERIFGGFCNVQ